MTTAARDVRPYNFQRQQTLERGRLRHLTPTLESIAHRISSAFTSTVHSAARVELGDLDQETWEHFADALPEPTFLASAVLIPGGSRIVLHLPAPLALAIVELRMGGAVEPMSEFEAGFLALTEPSSEPPPKALTDIEHRLVDEVAKRTLIDIAGALDAKLQLQVSATSSVGSSRFLQVPNPTDAWVHVPLRIEITDGVFYNGDLWLPTALVISILDVAERIAPVSNLLDDAIQDRVLSRVLTTGVDIAVRFPDISLSTEELLSLSPGDFIPLHQEQGQPLQLTVDGKHHCDVVPTARGRRLACTVVEASLKEEQ